MPSNVQSISNHKHTYSISTENKKANIGNLYHIHKIEIITVTMQYDFIVSQNFYTFMIAYETKLFRQILATKNTELTRTN